MKKKIVTAIAVFGFAITSFAQNFQGMAVYESKTTISDFKMEGRDITPEMQKMIQERMKKMLEKTFVLNFDRSTSIYKEEEKLDAPGQQGPGSRMMNSMMGSGGTFFKNVKEKSYTVDKEFMGKEFLIVDSLPKLNWKLESETKKIGDYNCFKATAVKPVSQSDFRNFRRKKEDTKSDEAKKEKTTNFMEDFEMPKEVTITAWYTPDVPVNQGPESYWGLPGLILEVNDGKTVIVCSKVVLNAKDKVEIKASKNGKVVKQKEYDDIVVKKMEEMREMSKGQQGGNRMQMRMGR
ncbi:MULTISPECIES: GLPGLI family protein [unclassified Flavobacterium]|uniref:GLPGLI family protein n=1 Tax=unclassified Flavobacterium TaxID=196869 RepID=UPI00086A680A|nr:MULTISPECIES: GLPGLI family protein [unclassified Flavobacterium]MBN9284342.1 GLPGLI family protein [Flavobacterium sp.]ODS85728.1 MAG: GLPGLI family protein [Chryseobacterium sp. SCN 40-13]OJV72961.1 MAG: GLPGLI family protein [Flavobacterium sp. 40-81]